MEFVVSAPNARSVDEAVFEELYTPPLVVVPVLAEYELIPVPENSKPGRLVFSVS